MRGIDTTANKQHFISAEQFGEIQSKVENIAKREEYQAVISDSLKKAEIARAISELYIAEQQNDKLKTAQIAGNLLFFFIKNNMVCFDENTESDLKFVWEIFAKEGNEFKSGEMILETLSYYQNQQFDTKDKKLISFRGISYPIASIYASGYDPYSFLLEMIKEKENDFDFKKWVSDKTNSSDDEPFYEKQGAISEEEALEFFRQEIKSSNGVKIELDGVDLIKGVFVVGYYVNNPHFVEKFYHEFSVKQVNKADYEKCKRNVSEGK